MARTNTFVFAGNGDRQTTIGGRTASSSCYARLNTDNAYESDCSIRVSAEVTGMREYQGACRVKCDCGHRWEKAYATGNEVCPQCDQTRQGADTRHSHFTVELPEPSPGCTVYIKKAGAWAEPLLKMGALLCSMKAADDLAAGNEEHAYAAAKVVGEVLEHLETKLSDLPDVMLPGDIPLKRALAAVKIVEAIKDQPFQN